MYWMSSRIRVIIGSLKADADYAICYCIGHVLVCTLIFIDG